MTAEREGCQWPHLTPLTAYGKGCRCDGCREKIAERKRAYREANREKIAERGRAYYEANREKTAERHRAYREANPHFRRGVSARAMARYAAATPALVADPYSEAEDAVIIGCQYGQLALAQALGRTYGSVSHRKARLRKKGLMS